MIDWSRIKGFDWDQGNARKSADKHDVSQAEAEQVFSNGPLLVSSDVAHSATEPRYHALGVTDEGRHLLVVLTLRAAATLICAISARSMNRKERERYEQA
jgi:uncharacterized DUF497 family protein